MKLTKKQRIIGLAIHLPILPLTLMFAIVGRVSKRIRNLDVFLANNLHSIIKKIKWNNSSLIHWRLVFIMWSIRIWNLKNVQSISHYNLHKKQWWRWYAEVLNVMVFMNGNQNQRSCQLRRIARINNRNRNSSIPLQSNPTLRLPQLGQTLLMFLPLGYHVYQQL